MKKLAIIGLGLMGGSLGEAVRRQRLARTVHGYARRTANRRQALKCGAVDTACERPEDAVKDADIVVLCLPVLAIPAFLRQCRQHLKPGCIVTDVGSTKAGLVRDCRRVLANTRAVFVGSHPIAGSDQSGIQAAHPDLYKGSITVVTPVSRSRSEQRAATAVSNLWRGVGARVVTLSPAEHDRLVAKTSHLPHLVAAMLVDRLGHSEDNVDELCGPGFRDATRIAGGSEDIWHDIIKSNRVAVGREIGALAGVLERVGRLIRQGDFEGLRRFLAKSRKRRKSLELVFERRGPSW